MTTEDDFQAALDANHDDWQTRLVFADWLQEQGDPRADYFRLAGERRWRPSRSSTDGYTADSLRLAGITGREMWRFYNAALVQIVPHTLPFDLGYGNWLHNTRRAAEDVAARALAALPAEQRAELLSPTASKRQPRKRKKGE